MNSKFVDLFFRKTEAKKPEKETDFYSFIEYAEKLVSEKEERIRILENCLKISSEEIKDYTHKLEDNASRLAHSSKFAAIGEMSASLSHEINTPLFVISCNVEIIEMTIEHARFEQKGKLEKPLHVIKETVDKIKKIATSLKNISNDNNNYKKKPVNLGELLTESTMIYNEQLKNMKVDFQTEFESDPILIDIASVEFSQVIINLITNAKQAVESLEDASERYIKVTVSNDSDYAYIKIINGGPPIPKENIAKIFDSFFTTKPVGVGTGLGLAISRKIVYKMGGLLLLDEGALSPAFIIKLPLRDIDLDMAS